MQRNIQIFNLRHQAIKYTILAVVAVPEVIAKEIALIVAESENQSKEDMKNLFDTMENLITYLSLGYTIRTRPEKFSQADTELNSTWNKAKRKNPHIDDIQPFRFFYNNTEWIRLYIKEMSQKHKKDRLDIAWINVYGHDKPIPQINDLDLYQEP